MRRTVWRASRFAGMLRVSLYMVPAGRGGGRADDLDHAGRVLCQRGSRVRVPVGLNYSVLLGVVPRGSVQRDRNGTAGRESRARVWMRYVLPLALVLEPSAVLTVHAAGRFGGLNLQPLQLAA
jgi:hypothetical protein